MSRVVHLHVGTPKSGTTFLQSLIRHNREKLAESGLLIPFTTHRANYAIGALGEQVVDGTELPLWAADRWREFEAAVAEWTGNVLISHEGLGRSSAEHVSAMVDQLEKLDLEVRVVVTARDLARLTPSSWQQTIKAGRVKGFAAYIELISSEPNEAFWRDQDLETLLPRWIARVGADNLTVVTAPPSGAPSSMLWERFAEAVEVDSEHISDFDPARLNQRLMAADVEILRRMNVLAWERDADDPGYFFRHDKKRVMFSERFAVSGKPSGTPTYKAEHHPWVEAQSARLVKAVSESGCRVIGDLADLAVGDEPPPGVDPDGITDREIAERVPQMLEDVYLSYETQIEYLEQELDQALTTPSRGAPRESLRRRLGRMQRSKRG